MHDPALPSSTPSSPGVKIPPPLVFVATFVLGVYGGRWLGFAHASPAIEGALRILGGVLIVGGITLALSSIALFARAHTTVIPHGRPAALVTSGPYRWTRNPMYVGLSAVYLGTAAFMGAIGPVVTLPLAVLVIGTAVIPHEERGLTRLFGAEYTSYCTRVRRWL